MKSEGLTPEQLAERNAQYVTEISRLEKERAALAAENALARKAVQAFCEVVGDNTEIISELVGQDGVLVILKAMKATGNMSATDAFLAEVRAQGVEMYADNLDNAADDAERGGFDYAVKFLRSEASGVRLFADQLRKGGNQ
ncbi:TPA: hypothetical protein LGK78_004378 [Escherichia coli]|uniref:hypothetical protein n=1 Tax=Escherichia coli TaxID=562 RepID=UPI000DA4E701|nr:hypothetical protein [Escherichia coli]HCC1165343.1 hypothetical protein [Salmonella enterica subsp. enterica serovar Choleraesuis]EEW0965362.1 hypothetical protein [Escherichia coli]EEW1144983.1 hypothetical protein [Escherichia coli]EFE7453278.1 hypothetical protein [Escherichia coli]EFH6276945.1 hypothetical protein [Escherichia coli]